MSAMMRAYFSWKLLAASFLLDLHLLEQIDTLLACGTQFGFGIHGGDACGGHLLRILRGRRFRERGLGRRPSIPGRLRLLLEDLDELALCPQPRFRPELHICDLTLQLLDVDRLDLCWLSPARPRLSLGNLPI